MARKMITSNNYCTIKDRLTFCNCIYDFNCLWTRTSNSVLDWNIVRLSEIFSSIGGILPSVWHVGLGFTWFYCSFVSWIEPPSQSFLPEYLQQDWQKKTFYISDTLLETDPTVENQWFKTDWNVNKAILEENKFKARFWFFELCSALSFHNQILEFNKILWKPQIKKLNNVLEVKKRLAWSQLSFILPPPCSKLGMNQIHMLADMSFFFYIDKYFLKP